MSTTVFPLTPPVGKYQKYESDFLTLRASHTELLLVRSWDRISKLLIYHGNSYFFSFSSKEFLIPLQSLLKFSQSIRRGGVGTVKFYRITEVPVRTEDLSDSSRFFGLLWILWEVKYNL